MRILVLFFPWVNDVNDASPDVPFINNLWQPAMKDWTEALFSHARTVGFPTEEVRHLVMNFVFTHCLPRETRLVNGLEENSDNEDIVDELIDLNLEGDELLEATRTHVRGSGHADLGREDAFIAADHDVPGEQEPAAQTRLYDMTMQMFRLSSAIWLAEDQVDNEAAHQRCQEMQENSASRPVDHDLALCAAKASADSAKSEGSAGLIGEIGARVDAGKAKNNQSGCDTFLFGSHTLVFTISLLSRLDEGTNKHR